MSKAILSAGLMGVLGAVLASGCASEVSEGYKGEPLLRIEGNVKLTAEVDSDSVPALVFIPGYDGKPKVDNHFLIQDGHVSGEFPAHFEFSVTDLPPEGSIRTDASWAAENDASSQGNHAGAYLAMVPREHPQAVDLDASYIDWTDTCSDKDVGDSCTKGGTVCLAMGSACVEQQYECVVEECPVISASGDATLLENDYPSSSWEKPVAGMAAIGRVLWDPADATRSYVDVRVCNWRPFQEDNMRWSDPRVVERCTLKSETGDTNAADLWRRYRQSATNAVVIYAEKDIALGWDIFPVSAGYNVFRRLVTEPEELAEVVSCRSQAWLTAVTEYNAEHGSSYIPFEVREGDNGYDTVIARVRALRADCPALWDKVGAGDKVSLTLGPLP